MKTTGFDDAYHVPVGATVDRIYFCEPGHATIAADLLESDTHAEALEAAIVRHEQAEIRHREAYASTPDDAYLPLPERFCIDRRWRMSWPIDSVRATSGTDTVVQRTHYDSLDDARAHLARLRWVGTKTMVGA